MYSVVLMLAVSGGAELPERGCGCSCSCSCRSCHGCRGCHGCNGCHGCRKCHKCHGCHSCHGCHACHGCHGCQACHGCHAVCTGCAGAPAVAPKKKKTAGDDASTEAPATILVNLPADARLSIDGNATTSSSDRRTFNTPVLPVGEQFQYTLRAEILRDGRNIVETQQVNVRGGEETVVDFSFATTSVASAR